MATLQVQSNGSAPSNAKVGDHIVTAGGTYQVLDGSQYQGKSAEELASAGVGYNPTSGLYSKKISDVTNFTGKAQSTIPQLSLRTSDTARLMTNQQNQKVSADLDSAYYQNRQDAYNSYMDAITRQNQQANDVNQAYLDNISRLYDDTYKNNNAVLERMASRGLTSSGLGNAMQVSALANASKQNADYRAQRNRDLNNIETEMNNLTNQYNVNLDTLAKKLRSDKISALSQNEIAFLEQVMAIEEYNANAENQALTTQQQQAFDAEQSMLNREYESSEKALDRELQKVLAQMQLNGSFSGGGGYGRGGYSRGYRRYGSGGYSRYGSGSSSSGSALKNSMANNLAGASTLLDGIIGAGGTFGAINAGSAQYQLDRAASTLKAPEITQMKNDINKKQSQKKKTQPVNTVSTLRYNPGNTRKYIKKTAVKSTKKGTKAATKKVKK